MADFLTEMLRSISEQMAAKNKTKGTAKAEDPIKLEREKLKKLRSNIKNLNDRPDNEDGSPLKTFTSQKLSDIDMQMILLDNEDPTYNSKIFTETQTSLDSLITAHNDWPTAGKFVDSPTAMFTNIAEKEAKKEDKVYKKHFESLSTDKQAETAKVVENVNKFVDGGVYDNFTNYVAAIRKQYKTEEDVLTNNPAVAEKLRNIKRKLQDYHDAAQWSAFLKINPSFEALKVFKAEGTGLRPVFQLTPAAEEEYVALQNQYSAIIFNHSGYHVAHNPLPVSFEEVHDADGKIKEMHISGTNNPAAIMFNAKQIKDKNEIIELAGAGRASKELKSLIGVDGKEFHTSLSGILDNENLKANFHPRFISTMETVEEEIELILNQLNVDPEELSFAKTEFLIDIPDDPNAIIDPYLPEDFREKIPEEAKTIPESPTLSSTVYSGI